MHPQDGVIRSLDKSGLPVTRANYILRMHGSYPSDDEWGAEHEDALPLQLRNLG